jgi:putative phosphoribosyl transferase
VIPGRKSERDGTESQVSLDIGEVTLEGTLHIPANPAGVVLFAHGSGSSRFSPRNRYVAGVLHSQSMATLLFDLLTREEDSLDQRTGKFRFDIGLLARRLAAATRYVAQSADLRGLAVGYFGASTGAGAALAAAAELPDEVSAIVSRGGRPDLAGEALASVRAPTLLIVGGNDETVLELNGQALAKLASREKKLVVIPGATHLFEEPGALQEVARLAAEWFRGYLVPGDRSLARASMERRGQD